MSTVIWHLHSHIQFTETVKTDQDAKPTNTLPPNLYNLNALRTIDDQDIQFCIFMLKLLYFWKSTTEPKLNAISLMI